MTKNFDLFVESILNEMMPATSEFGSGTEMGHAVTGKIPAEKSQHWGPLQKLDDETRKEVAMAIISKVFSDNENNTYSSVIDTPEQLKDAIKDAIKEVAEENPKFQKTLGSGKWAVQFLADRLANKELLGKTKYTTSGGEELKKEVTQKEVSAVLKKAVDELHSAEAQKAKIEKGVETRTPTARAEEFSTTSDYILIPPSEREINRLAGEDRQAYDALVDSGAEELSSGRELHSVLKRSGITVSSIPDILNSFINKGILTKEEESSEERPIDIEDMEGEELGFGTEELPDFEEYGV